ncbi:hypothetical protein [Acidovorax sp. sic0104]|uniref:hypothetical protein n=1 Tax=Acidovorax sp. sic0104 TaxID=2854784 RepID=UPI001C46DFB9|nr:hypothetical protein [Acidovorax sp. sic0104]MBV7542025.1 hypothetical protein [Acidovorax sp. sic0104]
MTQLIPHQVRTRIAFHVSQLVEHANALTGVQRARGTGHILSLELGDRMERITAAFATLTEIHHLAHQNNATAEFLELVTGAGLPDLKPLGLEASDLPSWAHLHPETGFQVMVRVVGTASDEDDLAVAGDYPFWVNVTRPITFRSLTEQEKSSIAQAVLDEFHDRQGIAVLDDFNITVELPTAQPISDDDQPDTTHLVASVGCDW